MPYYRTKGFVDHFTVKKATAKDVVLLGFENETEEQKHAVPLARSCWPRSPWSSFSDRPRELPG